jgi:hypothetical protein
VLDSGCLMGICRSALFSCIEVPVPDGTACDDGLACTVSDYCVAGTCAGDPDPCGADGCDSYCDELTGGCVAGPAPDGLPCNDADFCTSGDACLGGVCIASPRTCDDANDCTVDSCDAIASTCVNDATGTDGASCEDGEFCFTGDTCAAGVCNGTISTCGGTGDQCNTGTCDSLNRTCAPVPFPNGTPCDDGDPGTAGDQCVFGNCTGT